MPIEFNCQQCRHRLRTPDDAAGKQSRCPQCGQIQTIPSHGTEHSAVAEIDSACSGNPFADDARSSGLNSNPYGTPGSVDHHTATRQTLTLPGSLLIVVAGLNIAFLALGLLAGTVSVIADGAEPDDVMTFAFIGVTLVVQFLILWGGINMVRRRGYAMALVGVIAAMTPLSLCWCLHLPFGVWALVALLGSGSWSASATREIGSASR